MLYKKTSSISVYRSSAETQALSSVFHLLQNQNSPVDFNTYNSREDNTHKKLMNGTADGCDKNASGDSLLSHRKWRVARHVSQSLSWPNLSDPATRIGKEKGTKDIAILASSVWHICSVYRYIETTI